LVSHGHSDHVGNTIELAERTNARVLCIYELALFFTKKGVKTAQGMNKGGTVTLDGLSVTMVDARHSADIDAGGSVVPGGEAAGFVLRFESGRTLYHAGDTGVFGDMKIIGELYKPDVAMVPIGDLYTMGPREAAYACRLLKPKTIIGMHYGTFPALTGTPAALKTFLPAPMRNRVLELTPGVGARV
jgi:L-ascorbate metabolism protein UlaG (beta-lactamase superfamily)